MATRYIYLLFSANGGVKYCIVTCNYISLKLKF
nr:MAG TPA: hypothetical protein [Caudoviricetes sp.]